MKLFQQNSSGIRNLESPPYNYKDRKDSAPSVEKEDYMTPNELPAR